MSQLIGRVLVVDDNEMWLEIFSDILLRLGLEVVEARTYLEAVKFLDTQYFHLAVIDVRLKEDALDNTEGMALLDYIDEMGIGDFLVKIVITGFGTREWAREAFKRHNVYDFIHKQGPEGQGFDPADFVQSVSTAFAEHVRIDTALKLTFVDGTSLDQMALDLVELDKDTTPPAMLRLEIDDLLRKLFFGATSLTLSRFSQGHSSSTGVLKVAPFYVGQGQAAPVVAKYGWLPVIRAEACNYDAHVRRFVSGRRYTVLDTQARTKSLGGIVYSFIGAPLEKIQSFNQFYAKSSSSEIGAALQDLFENCRKWYENRDSIQVHDMRDLYWLPATTDSDNLHKAFEQMYGRFRDRPTITFPGLKREFVNPIYHDFVADRPLYLPVYLAVTHGDLNGENILVDHENHTWLIDFARTGKGHITRDFVALESVIKFQLLEEDSLEKLQAFEEALLLPNRLTDEIPYPPVSMSEQMEKAFTVIQCLRSIAANLIQPSSVHDYYAGLFYSTFNLMRYYHLLKLKQKKYHILMSSALLCERLIQFSGS